MPVGETVLRGDGLDRNAGAFKSFALGRAMEQGGGPLSLLRRTAPLAACVFDRGQSIQTAVRTELVVILPPGFDQLPGFGEPEEKMFIEALVAKFAVEALDESVLHRLAGLDVAPGDPLGGPAQHRIAGQFGAVIADDGVRQPRWFTTSSNSRTMRPPPSEVSTAAARHLRLKSSSTHRPWKRRPSASRRKRKLATSVY
jgi:hypothetical protein